MSGPRPRAGSCAAGWADLTPAEQRVARLVARGLRYETIAAQLGIAVETARVHVKHIAERAPPFGELAGYALAFAWVRDIVPVSVNAQVMRDGGDLGIVGRS